MSRRLSVLALSTLAASVSVQAQPQPDGTEPAETAEVDATENETRDAEARMRFQLGSQLYERGRFEEASAEFRRAYDLSGRPSLLYNVYLAERDAGNVAAAAEALRRYLDEEEAPENRALLESRLQSLEELAAREHSDPQQATPDAPTPDPEPAAETAAPEPQQPPADEPAEESARPSLVAPLLLVGGGAAILAAAGGLGLANRTLYNDLQDRCLGGTLCTPSQSGDIDALGRRNLTADVLLGLGGAVVLGGLVWLVLRAIHPETDVASACGPRGCQLRGRF